MDTEKEFEKRLGKWLKKKKNISKIYTLIKESHRAEVKRKKSIPIPLEQKLVELHFEPGKKWRKVSQIIDILRKLEDINNLKLSSVKIGRLLVKSGYERKMSGGYSYYLIKKKKRVK